MDKIFRRLKRRAVPLLLALCMTLPALPCPAVWTA